MGTGDIIQQVLNAQPLALQPCHRVGDTHRRRYAVLVSHDCRIGAVANGLLVAEDEPVHTSDPLKAGQCSAIIQSVTCGNLAQQARGHNRVSHRGRELCALIIGHGRNPTSLGIRSDDFTQKRTDVIAGELSPAAIDAAIRNSHRAAVRIRVSRDDDIRVFGTRQLKREVQRAGFLRVRERYRRELRIRRELLLDHADIRETCRVQCAHDGLAADAMHRGEDNLRCLLLFA